MKSKNPKLLTLLTTNVFGFLLSSTVNFECRKHVLIGFWLTINPFIATEIYQFLAVVIDDFGFLKTTKKKKKLNPDWGSFVKSIYFTMFKGCCLKIPKKKRICLDFFCEKRLIYNFGKVYSILIFKKNGFFL